MIERFKREKQEQRDGLAIGTRYAVTYLDISCPIVYELDDHTFDSCVRRFDSYGLSAPGISRLYTVVEYLGDGRYIDLVSNIEFRRAVVDDDILDTVTQSYEKEAIAIYDDLIDTPISLRGTGFVALTPEIKARILNDTLPRSEEIVSALEQVQNISRAEIEKFYEKLKPLTIMNNTMKIHPTFIEEHKRVVDRNIIIHSHETFSNVVDKNYNKSYIDSFYDMLFNNHKNYSEMRQNLKLKQSNKNNSNIENNNLSEQILPSINKNKINLYKEKKGKSFEIIKKRKNVVSKIKKYKRIKDNDEVYNTVLRLNDDNKRLFSFLVSGEKIRREYENKFINHLNRKLRLYSFKMNNLKPIKYNSIFIPSFIKSNNFFL